MTDSFYLNPPPALRQVQLRLLEILSSLDVVCKRHEIPYWLTAGTLLGAVRHKGFIPWDDDMDVVIRHEDAPRLHDAILASMDEFPAQTRLLSRKTNRRYYHGSFRLIDTGMTGFRPKNFCGIRYKVKEHPFLDILPFRRYSYPKEAMQKKSKFYSTILKPLRAVSGRLYYRCLEAIWAKLGSEDGEYFGYATTRIITTMSYQAFFPQIELDFEGRRFSAPSDFHEILVQRYGEDHMKFPPDEKMLWHHLDWEST